MTPRRQQAYDLWRTGLKLREVAARMGISVERARQLTRLAHRCRPGEQRQIQNAHLNARYQYIEIDKDTARYLISVLQAMR